MNWLTKLIQGYPPAKATGRITPAAAKVELKNRGHSVRRVKYHDIVADAASLGVTRQHLWSVLKGQRTGRSLLARYADLKKEAK